MFSFSILIEKFLNTLLPTSLRTLFLICTGLSLFHIVTEILASRSIDIASALTYGWENDKLCHDIRHLSRVLWCIYFLTLPVTLFFPVSLAVILAWMAVLVVLVQPGDIFSRHLRVKLISSLGRTVSFWQWKQTTPLVDIVVGDVLTSYSKVFAEWDALLFCYLLPLSGEQCIPSIISVLLVWLRQCIGDYRSSQKHNARALLNAIKYSTSFPLIYVSFLLLHPQADPRFRSLWLLFVTVNTIYSCLWDIFIDWNLIDFNFMKKGKSITFFRPMVNFPVPFYILATLVNCMLRGTWMVRLISSAYYPSEHGLVLFLESNNAVFMLQLLEVFRRFLWLMLRIDSHHAQLSGQNSNAGHSPLPLRK